jgi:hypothetical protein
MKTTKITRVATLLSATAFLAAASILPASAQGGGGGGGGGVESFGDCSNDINTTWILDAEHAGSQIKVEAQVFSVILDETWKWKLTDNGQVVAKGTAMTDKEHQDRAYFRIRRTIADSQGSDLIAFNAARVGSTQTCSGSVTL